MTGIQNSDPYRVYAEEIVEVGTRVLHPWGPDVIVKYNPTKGLYVEPNDGRLINIATYTITQITVQGHGSPGIAGRIYNIGRYAGGGYCVLDPSYWTWIRPRQ